MNSTDEMRSKLLTDVSYAEGKQIRDTLHSESLWRYVQKHKPEDYIAFMNRHTCKFEVCHAQSRNHPWYMEMFSVVSQHVYGDCVEECLDKAMAIEAGERSWGYERWTPPQ